jgi:Copper amine oxidase N-terminal domain
MMSTGTVAFGNTISLTRDSVIPVVVENDIILSSVKEGDHFTAHVEGGRGLPERTRLIGRVVRVRNIDQKGATVNMEFTDIILPDGSRHVFDAVPVTLDSKYVSRGEDGRFFLKPNNSQDGAYVIGGLVGGFIIGSVVHKQAEGSLLGLLGGAIAAVAQHKSDRVLSKGQVIGALIERNQTLETYRFRSDLPGYDPKSQPVVSFDGKPLSFSPAQKAYRDRDAVMIPLEAASRQLGLTYDLVRDHVIFVESGQDSLRLEIGSSDFRINGKKVSLDWKVTERDGVVFAPAEVLALVRKGNFTIDGTPVNVPSP